MTECILCDLLIFFFFWLHNLSVAVDSMEENRKVYVDLNLVTSDQPVSEVKAHIESQRVPTAEIEFNRPENEDEQKKQQVNHILFYFSISTNTELLCLK